MRIEHLALYVEDLEAAKNFFEKYLEGSSNEGYHNKTTDFRSYFISFEDGARLELMQKPNIPSLSQEGRGSSMGYAHLAFSLGSKEAVDTLTARFLADGYPVLSGPRTTGDGYYESCIRGFEGNLIELTL